MVKIRLVSILLLSVICITIPAGATTVTTSGSGNLSALSFGVNDTIIVAAGHTLTVDAANSITTPIVRMIFVRSTGTLAFTAGMGLMCNAVVLGNRASAPFSSSNGGTLTMAATSYLYLKHDAGFTYDVEPGPNSTVSISVNVTNPANAAQIYMYQPATNGYGRFYVGNTTAAITLSGVRFKGFIRAAFTGGVEFNASGRAASTTTIYKCFFDTSNVAFISVTGHKVDQCTFNLPVINNNGAVLISGGIKDTVWASTITIDANGGSEGDQKGIYINNQDSTVIQGCTIQELNSVSFGANSYGILIGGDYVQIKHCTITGFGFTIATASSADISGLIDSCYGYGTTTTHEWIILHAGDTGWTIRNNDIRFISGGGRSAITFYPSTTPPPHAYLYYNTINAEYGGSPAASAVGFEHTAVGNMTYNGVKMVGNILIGNNTGFNRAEMIFGTTSTQTVTVNFAEFKKNAFDSCYYYGTSSATYPYSRLDSNKHDQTAFGFVDSAAGDFRLDAASPLVNCGDSTYAIGVYGSAQASKAPFDIGYYQSYTTGTCGGAPSTPTGACCYNYTCAVVTEAQCTELSGVYQGNGTTTCSDCTAPSGTNPAPRSKQLRIGVLAYYAPIWSCNFGGYVPAMRDWFANRYSMIVTTCADASGVSYMKGINPNLKVIGYDLYSRAGTDSANIAAFSTSSGIPVDSMFLRTGPQVADSAIVIGNTGTADGAPYTTPGGNKFIRMYMGSTASIHLRYLFDARRWQFGSYLYSRFKSGMTSTGLDGIMMDEETRLTGLFPNNAGFQPYAASEWTVGRDSIVVPFTGINIANMPDSQVSWRANKWGKTLSDSMAANNKILIPNGASWWGLQASQLDSGFKVEGRHATVVYRGSMLNETMSNFYSYSYSALKYFPSLAYALKDSAVNLVLGYYPVGWVDSFCVAHLSINRQKMNYLGAMLMCEFSRTNGSQLWMFPRWQSGQYSQDANDFYHNFGSSRSWVCSTVTKLSDSDFLWSDAWGKYFGVPNNTRDTSQTGTDGSGTTYKVWKATFDNPNTPGTPLTFVAMRFPYGGFGAGIYGATTNINVTLPTGTWYELIDNFADSAGLGPQNYNAFWKPSALSGGSTFTLANGQARVFSQDTILANAGFNQSSTGTISIGDATVTEGGTATFTVTLSAAQAVLTTFNYSTANGTALSGTDYTATSGSKSIPIGSTSTTVTVPTTNRSGCQASRAFTVSITGVSPATLTIIDPTGTGTITDDDCGVTYSRSYRGKIKVTGKVKP